MPASIKDVANLAEVSTATVSHVLNGTRKISPATHARVMAAIAELGYSVNRAARNLAMGRPSSLLGIVISDIRNPFFPEIVSSFQDQAWLHQFEALVLNTNYDPERMVDCVKRLLSLQVAGVAVLTTQIDTAVPELLSQREIPAVYLDSGVVGRGSSNIAIDYEHGITAAVDHLRQLGHRTVAYVGGPVHLASARRRRRAFLDAVTRLGLDAVAAVDGDFSVAGGYQSTMRVLQGVRPTAIVAGNDLCAIGALHAAADAGLAVPSDLSVIGFDGIEFGEHLRPALTSMTLPRDEIGRIAYEALDRLARNPDQPGEEFSIPARLVERATTALARKPK